MRATGTRISWPGRWPSGRPRGLPVENDAALHRDYAQTALQDLREGGEPGNREDFTRALDTGLVSALEHRIGLCYRTRLAELKAGGRIPRHLDDPGQLRILSVLAGDQEFTMFRKREVHRIPMRIGELWFVNTAWEHEVSNPGSGERVALLANAWEIPACA